MFHLGIVHIDDWEPKRAIPLHGPEADDARRGLLVSPAYAREQFGPFRVQQEDEVRAVVDHEVRFQVEDLMEIRVILLRGLPLLRIDLEAVDLRKSRGDAVIRGEGIARCESDLRARLLEREGEDSGLGLDMEGHSDSQTAEGLLFLQRIPDRGEDGHVVSRPFDAPGSSLAELRHRAPMPPTRPQPSGASSRWS